MVVVVVEPGASAGAGVCAGAGAGAGAGSINTSYPSLADTIRHLFICPPATSLKRCHLSFL